MVRIKRIAHKKYLVFATPFLALLLTACGGGGGGGNDSSSRGPGEALSLSGTIFIPDAYAVDNDVNDVQGQNGPRNNPDDSGQPPGLDYPQSLSANPISVVGYANLPGEGPDGASWAGGDVDDYYRLALKKGQIVTLNFPDPGVADLDLYLLNGDGDTIIDSSIGSSDNEQLEIPEDGVYVVDVNVYAGASNYVLSIGLSPVQTAYRSVNLRHEFVPGEALVTVQPAAAAVEAASESSLLPSARTGFELRKLPGFDASGRYLEQSATQVMAYQSNPSYQAKAALVEPELAGKLATLMAIKEFGSQSNVALAEPNLRLVTLAQPDDPRYRDQWHYPLINLPQAWDLTTGEADGKEIIVAVVDGGVLLDHPDLRGQLVTGYDFISDPDDAADGDGRDPNPDDVPGSSFHGTHVAGTIAAASNNTRGVAGIAWQARLMPLRALGPTGGTLADVLEAVKYAAGLSNASGRLPEQRADIVNLSVGLSNRDCRSLPPSQTARAVYREAREAGVILIAAAGNDDCSAPSYPAGYDEVIAVSAVGRDKSKASYSNFGAVIDLAAPGGDVSDVDGDGNSDFVISTLGNSSGRLGTIDFDYGGMAGTSMASPHVAGVVALMEAVNGDLTPDELDRMIRSGMITEDLGSEGRDDVFGHGLINAYRAVLVAGGAPLPPLDPALSVSPGALNFGSAQTTLQLSLSNSGEGELTVSRVSADQPWLSVTPPSSSDGLGIYRIGAERSVLAEGNYFANLVIDSSVGDAVVSVAMRVSPSGNTSDAGRHYVLLVNAAGDNVVDSVAVVSENGRYDYRFDGVRGEADYVIFAGTDLDNDDFICAGADACGAYPSWSEPEAISVGSSSITELDFATNFLVPLNGGLQAADTVTGEPTASQARRKGPIKPLRGWRDRSSR